MSGVWKRSHGRTSEAPPDERGGNSYARPTATAPHSDSTITREKAYLEQEFGDDCRHFRAAVRRWLQRQSSHRLTETQCQRRCPRRSGPHRQSPRRRTDAPVRVSRRVRVPEHDLVEIDRLGLRAPVAVDAEARLCVDEGRAVAAGAIVAIGQGSLVVAAKCAVEPDVNAAAGVMSRIEAHLDHGPALPRQVAPADLCAHHHRRLGAGCAGGHLREEAHALAERPRLDLEEGAGVARLPALEGILLDLVDDRAARLASRRRNVLRPVTGDLERKTVPYGLAEFHQLAGAGRAVGSDLDLRPLAGHDAARLGLYRRGARALAVADIAPGLQHRLARAVEPVALLHRDAADRLADRVLDDADALRLQLAVELAGDPPLSQQLRGHVRIVGEALGEDWSRRPLRHRGRRRECSEEQQCRGAAPGVEPGARPARSRYVARSHHDGSLDRRAALR